MSRLMREDDEIGEGDDGQCDFCFPFSFVLVLLGWSGFAFHSLDGLVFDIWRQFSDQLGIGLARSWSDIGSHCGH